MVRIFRIDTNNRITCLPGAQHAKLGVPTELFMYPGDTHGIPDPRNQLVKAVAEMAWMDYYVRGSGRKFAWRDVLKTLEKPVATQAATSDNRDAR